MSIDVNYYSFSSSRADKEWPYFVEDLAVLRRKHATCPKYHLDSVEIEKKEDEIMEEYEIKLEAVRRQIFSIFDSAGFMIPWIEWDNERGKDLFGNDVSRTEEDKMAYLLNYGCVYQRGADLKDKSTPYLMLRSEAPTLETEYQNLVRERDEKIQGLSADIGPIFDDSVELNPCQERLENAGRLSYLLDETEISREQLIFDLKLLDIFYGSVENEYFESPKLEYEMLETICDLFDLENEQATPTRSAWIRFFENIDQAAIQRIKSEFMEKYGWSEKTADFEVREYLVAARPVAKDLKETPDSVFVRLYNQEDVEPDSAESLLVERAEKHLEQFKGLVPPVL